MKARYPQPGALFALILFSTSTILGAAQTATTPASDQGKDYPLTLNANQPWTDTGIDLQKGQVVHITGGNASCGQSATSRQDLPLPSAALGTLLAKLHADATPVVASPDAQFSITEPSHLYLGFNAQSCSGSLPVKVHVGADSAQASQTLSQGARLKEQLGAAAQIFMQGQFGIGGDTNAAAPASLKLSTTPLDATLRNDIDDLPRRVNDQFKNLGDMVNFVLIGSEAEVKAVLDAANWHPADTSNGGAVMAAISQTYENKDYLAMPMSTLYLFGRPQDFGYEMAEPIAMVASRHHFRLWKTSYTYQGQPVWAGAGTHDIGFAKDKRNGNVTHKIDPNVDGERTNIGQSLEKSGKVKSMTYYLPANPVQDAKNATGDEYKSDGKLLVIFLN